MHHNHTETMSRWSIAYAGYSAEELALLSGLSVDMQDIWMDRGWLPVRGERAEWSPFEVAEIAVRYELSSIGVPMAQSRVIDSRAVGGVLYHAFLNGTDACHVTGPASDVAQFTQWAQATHGIAMILAGSSDAGGYLVVGVDGRQAVIDDMQDLAGVMGAACVVLDLEAIGARYLERVPKPIAVVSFPCEPGRRVVQGWFGSVANDR